MDPLLNKRHKYQMRSSNHLNLYQNVLNSQRWTWSFYKAIKLHGLFNLTLPKVYAAEVSDKESKKEVQQQNKEKLSEKGQKVEVKAEVKSSEKPLLQSEEGTSECLVSDNEINSYIAKETKMDRLQQMVSLNNIGKPSHELRTIILGSLQAGVFVSLYTYYIAIRNARKQFQIENRTNVFKDVNAARRQFLYSTHLTAMTAGYKWGVKTWIFTGIILCISQTVSVCRNKSSPFDLSIGAAIATSIWRFRAGPKATFSAGVIGGIGGTLIGLFIYGLQKRDGDTYEERHFKLVKEMLETKKKYQQELRNLN